MIRRSAHRQEGIPCDLQPCPNDALLATRAAGLPALRLCRDCCHGLVAAYRMMGIGSVTTALVPGWERSLAFVGEPEP
ncbi:MAG: hypothetical protein GEU73_06030 [Chloroflexi bacterium]|nr:hypothetical protein [Chloroflexota bacterium]